VDGGRRIVGKDQVRREEQNLLLISNKTSHKRSETLSKSHPSTIAARAEIHNIIMLEQNSKITILAL